MKKIVTLCILSSAALAAVAQVEIEPVYWGDVPVIEDSYGHKITRDGTFSLGEAVTVQATWGRDNTTGELFFYEGCTYGYGNCVSQDHTVVGTDASTMQAAVFVSLSDPILITPMAQYTDSYAHGITWDGTKIVGFVSNPIFSGVGEENPDLMQMQYLPVVCERNPSTGEFGELTFLPVPKLDFTGMKPQYCTAIYISDDGKTIAGQVIDNSGFFVYPIVYKQNEQGEWSYILPSEGLSVPEGVVFPKYPEPEMESPEPQNFIGDAAKKQAFTVAWEKYLEDPYENPNPYDNLNPAEAGSQAYMTKEEWQAYQDYEEEYLAYINGSGYQEKVDQYYVDQAAAMAKCTNFLQSSIAMNNDGTKLSQTKQVVYTDGMNFIKRNIPFIFDLENGTYQQIGDDNTYMQVFQILPDGTLICATPKPASGTAPDDTPQHSYVVAPGTTTFVPVQDYIRPQNPELYDWMNAYLHKEIMVAYSDEDGIVKKDMFVTGQIAVSDDFTVMSAGVDGWSWDPEEGDNYTYFIDKMNTPNPAGVETLVAEPSDGVYRVFTLQGVKVLETSESNAVENLTKGIYIVNGKKILVK